MPNNGPPHCDLCNLAGRAKLPIHHEENAQPTNMGEALRFDFVDDAGESSTFFVHQECMYWSECFNKGSTSGLKVEQLVKDKDRVESVYSRWKEEKCTACGKYGATVLARMETDENDKYWIHVPCAAKEGMIFIQNTSSSERTVVFAKGWQPAHPPERPVTDEKEGETGTGRASSPCGSTDSAATEVSQTDLEGIGIADVDSNASASKNNPAHTEGSDCDMNESEAASVSSREAEEEEDDETQEAEDEEDDDTLDEEEEGGNVSRGDRESLIGHEEEEEEEEEEEDHKEQEEDEDDETEEENEDADMEQVDGSEDEKEENKMKVEEMVTARKSENQGDDDDDMPIVKAKPANVPRVVKESKSSCCKGHQNNNHKSNTTSIDATKPKKQAMAKGSKEKVKPAPSMSAQTIKGGTPKRDTHKEKEKPTTKSGASPSSRGNTAKVEKSSKAGTGKCKADVASDGVDLNHKGKDRNDEKGKKSNSVASSATHFVNLSDLLKIEANVIKAAVDDEMLQFVTGDGMTVKDVTEKRFRRFDRSIVKMHHKWIIHLNKGRANLPNLSTRSKFKVGTAVQYLVTYPNIGNLSLEGVAKNVSCDVDQLLKINQALDPSIRKETICGHLVLPPEKSSTKLVSLKAGGLYPDDGDESDDSERVNGRRGHFPTSDDSDAHEVVGERAGDDHYSYDGDEASDEQCVICEMYDTSEANPMYLCDGTCNRGIHKDCINDPEEAHRAAVEEHWFCQDCCDVRDKAAKKAKGTSETPSKPTKSKDSSKETNSMTAPAQASKVEEMEGCPHLNNLLKEMKELQGNDLVSKCRHVFVTEQFTLEAVAVGDSQVLREAWRAAKLPTGPLSLIVSRAKTKWSELNKSDVEQQESKDISMGEDVAVECVENKKDKKPSKVSQDVLESKSNEVSKTKSSGDKQHHNGGHDDVDYDTDDMVRPFVQPEQKAPVLTEPPVMNALRFVPGRKNCSTSKIISGVNILLNNLFFQVHLNGGYSAMPRFSWKRIAEILKIPKIDGQKGKAGHRLKKWYQNCFVDDDDVEIEQTCTKSKQAKRPSDLSIDASGGIKKPKVASSEGSTPASKPSLWNERIAKRPPNVWTTSSADPIHVKDDIPPRSTTDTPRDTPRQFTNSSNMHSSSYAGDSSVRFLPSDPSPRPLPSPRNALPSPRDESLTPQGEGPWKSTASSSSLGVTPRAQPLSWSGTVVDPAVNKNSAYAKPKLHFGGGMATHKGVPTSGEMHADNIGRDAMPSARGATPSSATAAATAAAHRATTDSPRTQSAFRQSSPSLSHHVKNKYYGHNEADSKHDAYHTTARVPADSNTKSVSGADTLHSKKYVGDSPRGSLPHSAGTYSAGSNNACVRDEAPSYSPVFDDDSNMDWAYTDQGHSEAVPEQEQKFSLVLQQTGSFICRVSAKCVRGDAGVLSKVWDGARKCADVRIDVTAVFPLVCLLEKANDIKDLVIASLEVEDGCHPHAYQALAEVLSEGEAFAAATTLGVAVMLVPSCKLCSDTSSAPLKNGHKQLWAAILPTEILPEALTKVSHFYVEDDKMRMDKSAAAAFRSYDGRSDTPQQTYQQPYGVSEQSYGVSEQSYGVREVPYGVTEPSYSVYEQTYRLEEQLYGVGEQKYGVSEQKYGKPSAVLDPRRTQYNNQSAQYDNQSNGYDNPSVGYAIPNAGPAPYHASEVLTQPYDPHTSPYTAAPYVRKSAGAFTAPSRYPN